MILAARGLAVGYRSPLLVAGELEFAPGTVTAILGPNGVGKSTLLLTLAGLLAPIRGALTVGGRDLVRLRRSERARLIAFLSQEETSAFPTTVREAVAIGRLPHSVGVRETPADLAAIETAIARVDLAGQSESLLERLSGGQRRRAMIARALAQEAPVVLLDEPLAHLDPAHANEVLRTLDELRAMGRTVVATFHDADAALVVADRVLLLAEGAVTFSGEAEAVDDAALGAAYGIAFERHETPHGSVRRPVWRIRP